MQKQRELKALGPLKYEELTTTSKYLSKKRFLKDATISIVLMRTLTLILSKAISHFNKSK